MVLDHKSSRHSYRCFSIESSYCTFSELKYLNWFLGCSVRLFGSSIHGMGLKSSDVNIDLQVPTGSSPSAMLKEVSALLLTAVHFEWVYIVSWNPSLWISQKYLNTFTAAKMSHNIPNNFKTQGQYLYLLIPILLK